MKKFLFLMAAALSVGTACGYGETSRKNMEEKSMEMTGNVEIKHLTKADFLAEVYDFEKSPEEWKYKGDKPAIVDFYASWCGPCKMIAPILQELAGEYAGKVIIYKVDTEAEKELAAAFGIRSIPTLLFIPREGQPQVAQGAMPKAEFKKVIDGFLLKK